MNTYEKIRELRNKREAPKLEFGCEIQFEDEPFTDIYIKNDSDHNRFTYNDTHGHSDSLEVKNLGKPVTIADILRLIQINKDYVSHCFLNLEGYIEIECVKTLDQGTGEVDVVNITLDLTKEIKAQDCLKEIYELIK